MLKDETWKYDIVPEFMDGKNIADFVDPDILQRLDELEKEEEMLEYFSTIIIYVSKIFG